MKFAEFSAELFFRNTNMFNVFFLQLNLILEKMFRKESINVAEKLAVPNHEHHEYSDFRNTCQLQKMCWY